MKKFVCDPSVARQLGKNVIVVPGIYYEYKLVTGEIVTIRQWVRGDQVMLAGVSQDKNTVILCDTGWEQLYGT